MTEAVTTVDDAARKRRVELLSDARLLIGWLEAHPEVPLQDIAIRYSVQLDDDKSGIEEVERIARAAGTEVVVNGEHHQVHARVGAATYQATYIEREHMRRYNQHMAPYIAEVRA